MKKLFLPHPINKVKSLPPGEIHIVVHISDEKDIFDVIRPEDLISHDGERLRVRLYVNLTDDAILTEGHGVNSLRQYVKPEKLV